MARSVRYSMAMSLDGFIAGPQGEVDWIVHDPEVDFAELFAPYDTLVMGRSSYEATKELGGGFMGMKAWVCSTTLGSDDCPGATVTSDAVATVGALKAEQGKEIWLFGGGVLFPALRRGGAGSTMTAGAPRRSVAPQPPRRPRGWGGPSARS